MGVLRTTLLIGAVIALVSPAAAAPGIADPGLSAPDLNTSQITARISLAEARAVQAAFDAAKDGGNAIEKTVLEGVRDYYEVGGFAPVWLKGGDVTPQMSELRSLMDRAGEYGLDPAAYATPSFRNRRYYDPAERSEADVEFSRAVARFVVHVASGTIVPTDIGRLITLKPERPDVGEALSRLSQASSVETVLAEYEPQHPQYRLLKAKLADLRELGPETERIVMPEGGLLKPGMTDERIAILRQRLGVEAAPEAEPNLYDDALVEAVETFQREHGLSVDGIVGPSTRATLNGRSREEDIAAIVANLERWRWMPRDLGAFYVQVNVPEFVVRVVDDGKVVHQTRVVVGKPSNKTPTFSNKISHLIVNPYWNVPASIVRNELLPAARGNPGAYFQRHGYEVFANVRGRMRQINPWQLNWYRVSANNIRIRQVPGAHNALGRIKFMFPNQHSVYLHDTPSKSLFARDRRAFSHGCVRVQNPLEFADAILPVAAPDWNAARLEQYYGGRERRINLDHPVPVHLTYFTMWVDEDGKLRGFEDIYGYDREITEFLGF